MTDTPAVPPDFVSYVERRLPALEGAALRLTGQEAQAERLAREMLGLVALRWSRLTRADVKRGLEPTASADAYLLRLFRQEAEELAFPQTELRLDGTGIRRRATALPRMRTSDEAEVIWGGARRTIKRRWILAAIAAGTAGVLALCQGRDREPEASSEPEPVSSTLPTGADRLPAAVSAGEAIPGLPEELTVPGSNVAALTALPVMRALAMLTSARTDTSPIYVLGTDMVWRRVDNAPEFGAMWLHTGSLSPDGHYAAFGTSNSTVVVDLRTGQSKAYPPARPSNRPVWLTSQHLILAKDQMIDVVSGANVAIPVGPEDVLLPQNPPGAPAQPFARLSQLLSVGEPVTAPARAQRWATSAVSTALTPVNQQLRGPIGDLVGPWRGQGFVSGNGFAVRACAPAAVPSLNGATGVAIAARLDGQLVRALVIGRPVSLRVLGWLDGTRALLGLVSGRQQQIASWDVVQGTLVVVSRVNSDGILSLPDLTSAG
ncbi:SigE family RNA polymerase sigma factor [Catelliglobosispora koreensis]|uniref:hypothetical protein n=1 Tax=Catelliglobosispora koreensis TaxID=129052 RepID=UPI00039CBD8F|nr:hypothetical protein [Catelliglobosispora koreensis]